MLIENELKKIKLPDIYVREGRECFFDPYRKKLIEITPEEIVRQKVAKYFEVFCGVPPEMISLEVPMSYYAEGHSGRADIVIHAIDEKNGCAYPITIIECKNEDVFLTDKVADQVMRYCDILAGKYIVITNGIEIEFAVYEDVSNSYIRLDSLLTYEEMINNEYCIPDVKKVKLRRFTLKELKNQQLLEEYNDEGPWVFGNDTKEKLRSFVINLYQAFLDTEHKLPVTKRKNFELVEDIGQRYMDYGNAGGGHYNGIYRSFLIKDCFFEPQIVSLSIFGTDPNFRGENRTSYTSLTVAIDSFKKSHNSLQYNMDRFVEIDSQGIGHFKHNGQISSIKSSEVISVVEKKGEGLKLLSTYILLGNLSTNKLLYLDDEEVAELVYNLIEYALLRDEVRKSKKEK